MDLFINSEFCDIDKTFSRLRFLVIIKVDESIYAS